MKNYSRLRSLHTLYAFFVPIIQSISTPDAAITLRKSDPLIFRIKVGSHCEQRHHPITFVMGSDVLSVSHHNNISDSAPSVGDKRVSIYENSNQVSKYGSIEIPASVKEPRNCSTSFLKDVRNQPGYSFNSSMKEVNLFLCITTLSEEMHPNPSCYPVKMFPKLIFFCVSHANSCCGWCEEFHQIPTNRSRGERYILSPSEPWREWKKIPNYNLLKLE